MRRENSRAFAPALALLTAALVAGGTADSAQAAALSVDDAVARAIANAPEMAQAEQQLATRAAVLREARGLFDSGFVGDFRVDYAVEELVGSRLKSELDRRLQLEIPPPILDEAARLLRERLPTDVSLLNPVNCVGASTLFVIGEARTVVCMDDRGNLLGVLDPSVTVDPSLFASVDLAESFEGLTGLDARIQLFADSLQAFSADTMRIIADILNGTATSLRIQRDMIGGVPKDREIIVLDAGLDYRKPFRNGSALVSTVSLASSEDNFRDKALDPLRGDSFVANNFRLVAGLALEIPIGRGAGKVSYAAPFYAAEKAEDAAEALFEQTASERALEAIESYWDVVAANRRLALLEGAVVVQDRLLSATGELVEAGVVARLDIERNRAQRANAVSAVASARRALGEARAQLARVIGADASEVAGSETSADFAPWLGDGAWGSEEPEALVARALAERDDVRAAQRRVEAESLLVAAAEHDLKPQVALQLNASYNAYHESFDLRFYDAEGFAEAFDEPWSGPSYGISFRFRLPIGNNAARGRLLQARSSTTSSEIDAVELKRSVRLSVLEQRAQVAAARAELESRRESLSRNQEAAEGTEVRFRAGDLTVLDTLLTRSELTRAGLELVAAERNYLSLLARLRFETGTLVEVPNAGEARGARLLPLVTPAG